MVSTGLLGLCLIGQSVMPVSLEVFLTKSGVFLLDSRAQTVLARRLASSSDASFFFKDSRHRGGEFGARTCFPVAAGKGE